MKLENAAKGLCVICSKPLFRQSQYTCKKCGQICQITQKKVKFDEKQTPGFMLMIIKSKCCDGDVKIDGSMTHADSCHELFIVEMEESFGKYKKVIDGATGLAHKIPTRVIMENGLEQEDLHKFPLWDDKET